MTSIWLNYINGFWLFRNCIKTCFCMKEHIYLKKDCQFFDALKTKDRKISGNCNILTKVKFRELEWSSPLTLFRMGFFRGNLWWWGTKKAPLLKNYHIYPTMMKLGTFIPYLKKIQKVWIAWNTPWVLLTSAFFHRKSANFAILRNTDIDYILINNF